MKQLIVIEGPTASGKTSLSVSLAKHYHTVIVSSDSRQFYKELSIGTAKPDVAEQDGIKHYFIDSHNLTDELSAGQYESEALEVLTSEFKDHDLIILTGGSGMFTDAVCYGLDPLPASDQIKDDLISLHEQAGLEPLLKELEETDPDYFEQVDKSNPSRVIRALEVIRLTGKRYSAQRTGTVVERPFVIHRFVIDIPRELLYQRINTRVDHMVVSGLIEEAESVHKLKGLRSLNTVGYKELFEYFEGKCTKEEAIALIKRNTRRYAKRQLTWFRRHPEAEWIEFTDNESMMQSIVQYISDKNKLE